MIQTPQHLMYIIPNLFTAMSCFFGMLSIFASTNHAFIKSVIFIFISLILDGLDGRVARLTNTSSKFGIEFDSLADIIAFGVAPSVLFYCSIGHSYGKIGVLVAAFFVIFGAIRLARFNVTTGTYEPNVFIGLPIPTAAICLCAWNYFYLKYELIHLRWLLVVLVMALSFLMVSNIRFPSFKKINYAGKNFIKVFILVLFLLGIFFIYPLEFSILSTTLYIAYGVFRAIFKICAIKFKKDIN